MKNLKHGINDESKYLSIHLSQSTLRSFLFPLAFFLLTHSIQAQKNVVKLNVGNNIASISYERYLMPHATLQFEVSGLYANDWGGEWGGLFGYTEPIYESDGEGLSINYRYYFWRNHTPLNGMYLSPSIGLQKHELIYRERNGEKLGYGFVGDYESIPIYAEGHKKVNVLSSGIKAGFQRNLYNLILEMGTHFTWNTILGNDRPVVLDNGSPREFRNNIKGFQFILYFGLGCAF